MIKKHIKKIINNLFPEKLIQVVKKYHYLKTLKDFNLNDESELLIIRKLVKNGDTVVDIGANFGIYTKFLSEFVGDNGRVYSFEPISQTFEILQNNINKLKLKNILAYNIALSNKLGSVFFEIPKDENGENFYRARVTTMASKNNLRMQKAKTSTLDQIFNNINENVSFIKCDVEGHEYNVILGGLNMIETFEPSILLELNDNFNIKGTRSFKTVNMLLELGYIIMSFDGKKLHKIENNINGVNYFFLKDQHVQLLQESNVFTD